jgi:ElaB/YqjD/DUF883 family membrane-anchored ribosome-binding protein
MSETNVPYGGGAGAQGSWAPGHTTGGAGADAPGVKDRATEAASQVGDAGRETAQEARERARDVAHEAGDRARGLVDRTRADLRTQVQSQQQHFAGGLRALGDELGQMAGGAHDPGYASDLVERAGQVTGRAARWFEEREPADVLHEVEDFARRRPGMFVLIAAGAGLLVGRFLRGAKDASGGDGDASRHGPGRSGTAAEAEGLASGGTPPPALPPTTPDGPGPQTTRSETYVEHT